MPSLRAGHRTGPAMLWLLAVVAILGLSAEAASLPHLHIDPEVGLYNLDHDLAYLATLGSAGLPAVVADIAPLPARDRLLAVAVSTPVSGAVDRAAARAPPVR